MKYVYSLVLAASLVLVGCAAIRSPQPLEQASPQQLAAQLPALPPGDTSRTTSLIGPLTVLGVGTCDDFGTVAYGAGSVDLAPPAGALAGAIYALPVNGFGYDEISFSVDMADSAKAWFAVGDYSAGLWALTPATDGITSVAPPYPTAHAPDGCAYFAVLAWDDTVVTVHDVSVAPDLPTWQSHVVDGTAGIGGYNADMVLINGYLYAAYEIYDPGVTEEIRLARATQAVPNETGQWDKSTVTASDGGEGLDLHKVNSLPALIYSEG
ncbi:hypothetical protein JW859_06495 [bacterium]|nr:hypothetical protein [bacterium]